MDTEDGSRPTREAVADVPVIEIDGLKFSTLEEFYVHFGDVW